MPVNQVSTKILPISNGFNGKISSSNSSAANNTKPVTSSSDYLVDSNYGSSLIKKNKIAFTSEPELAEKGFVKVTDEASEMLGEVLKQARLFAAERLGHLTRTKEGILVGTLETPELVEIEVGPSDFKKAITYFARLEKEKVSVGFEKILEREHQLHDTVNQLADKPGNIPRIGFNAVLEREQAKPKN